MIVTPPLTTNQYGDHKSREGLLIPTAFGGNRTSGPTDVATAVNAHGGPHGRQDFESETFIVGPLQAHQSRHGHAMTTQQAAEAGQIIAHTLRGEGFDASEDGSGRGTQSSPSIPSVAEGEVAHGVPGGDVGYSLRATPSHSGDKGDGGINTTLVSGMAVRRLTPIECERLMGMPDNYTRIPWRGKPADKCPDGPRYRAIGNSMAVPVIKWIGQRIELVEKISNDQ